MNDYNPDVWVIIKIKNEKETVYKLLCGWYGGFARGDEWRLNSGISKWKDAGVQYGYEIHGYSGSVYTVHASCERFSGLTLSIFNNFKASAEEHSAATVEHILFEDFIKEFENDQ